MGGLDTALAPDSRYGLPAFHAVARSVQFQDIDLRAISMDQFGFTLRAVSGFALMTGHVANVDKIESIGSGNIVCHIQRLYRCGRYISELIIWEKS